MCNVEGRASMSLRDLHVLADQTVAADFHLEEQQSFRLMLHFADGRPVRAADVKIVNDFDIRPCRETANGEYRSPPASPGSYTMKVRGPDVAPFQALVELTGTVVERTLPEATPVVFRFRPAGKAPERWVGALNVRVKDAQGSELVQDLLQIDGSDHFDWRLGLLPGSYTLTASEFMTNAQRMLQLAVSPGSAELQVVEVQLERR
jgi:hypothetical protein